MVFLGLQNSRMKDFYDIYVLSSHHSFEGNLLSRSLQATFERRHLDIPSSLIITSSSFLKMKEVQWTAFLKKFPVSLLSGIPVHLKEVVQRISFFLLHHAKHYCPRLLSRKPGIRRLAAGMNQCREPSLLLKGLLLLKRKDSPQ